MGAKIFKPKECAICKNQFVPVSARQSRCFACRERLCAFCGNRFTIKDFHSSKNGEFLQKHCSKKCGQQAQRQENPKSRTKENMRERERKYRLEHLDLIKERKRKYAEKFPWNMTYRYAAQRCRNPKEPAYARYGGRGIQLKMTREDIKKIWFRDKAYLLKEPSIDRIDNDGNYEIGNVRFIELVENRRKRDKKK